jgi:hypothetical protein
MSRATRARIAATLIASVCLLPVATAAQAPTAASTAEAVPRVRSDSPRLRGLIDTALASSATFRQLVHAIEATDGIVFVEEGPCVRGVVRACLEHRVTLAGGYRLLFARTAVDRSDIDIMASIGHELQHALEVLAYGYLRSNEAIRLFYRPVMSPQIARSAETLAAQAAGDAVARELRRLRDTKQ